MHSTSTRLEQVPLDKVVKAWFRFLVEILLYAVFIFYAVTFMTHTLTRFAQTYNQVRVVIVAAVRITVFITVVV